MASDKPSPRRCAIYTRKSSEEGLEQDFNSLHAQREACEAFIRSQKGEGWRLIETAYDDGGLSGGTMDRSALQRLLADIRAGEVDVVVVYKVDRLTRSLADFAKIVEDFDRHGVSFVAVTQQFNTTTSMGRLTLNILLSFAQFEREVTGERIRDKIAASKRKGMWMGGMVPLGYDAKDRKLVVNTAEAETVRLIFRKYLELGCVRRLKDDLDRSGVRSKRRISAKGARSGGQPFSRGALYALLGNPIYIGEIRHKGVCHAGQHEATIDRALWDAVQQKLRTNTNGRRERGTGSGHSPLAGKLFDEGCEPLTPSHAVKNGRRYRYYVSRSLLTNAANSGRRVWRLPAAEIERSVAAGVKQILGDQAGLAAASDAAKFGIEGVPSILASAAGYRSKLEDGTTSDVLRALVERVMLQPGGIEVTISLAALMGGMTRDRSAVPLVISRHIPLQLRRRGVETRLVIPARYPEARPADPALIKTVARARRWFEQLSSGQTRSTRAIARQEKITHRYVGRLLPLAFLAPAIVEAIAEGRNCAELTAETLTRQVDLPLDWREQELALRSASDS